jgi:hypothetical protein
VCRRQQNVHRWWWLEHGWTVTDLCGIDSERTLIVQNMFGGNIGGAEPCKRYHRHHVTMSEATQISQNYVRGNGIC